MPQATFCCSVALLRAPCPLHTARCALHPDSVDQTADHCRYYPGSIAAVQIHQPQTGMPDGGATPQHNCEAFPHGPLDPELAKDIEKLLDDTAKDASGPTTAEERAEHLQRYFQQVCQLDVSCYSLP